ncbi:P-loop containing nucleoside triphosphate hydrolase protein [Aspergillus bertholletiae]|uniref:P-loop containing nucleoside triphosphate hydrolase protein n=1 Tax=Aspergillus bertholletiae TaxID=1226010 RepID=A0A5N7AYK5_9EURO|nr:P-loop containing nucleoside triphosphate hydrolase protein [Aspergillus bertholletiae]
MASSINSTSVPSGMLPSMIEDLIPGFNFFSHLVSLFFDIDISSHLHIFAVVLAFWSFVLPTCWNRIIFLFLYFATSSEIWSHNKLYPSAMRWISLQPALNRTRQLVAGTRTSLSTPWDGEDGKADDEKNGPEDNQSFSQNPREFLFKRKCRRHFGTLRYTPSQDKVHFFTYKGSWVALHRQPYKETGSPWFANMERLYFYAAPWKRYVLDDLMNEIHKTPVNGDPKQVAVYEGFKVGSSFQWMQVASKQPRYLSTVALDQGKKRRVVEDLHKFLDPRTRSWYQSRGFPYRRGYLIHGPPGTGKSSLSLALASFPYLDIYALSLSAVGLDENILTTLFRDLPKHCIVLLEDVDEAGIKKRSSDSPPSGTPGHNGVDRIPGSAGSVTLSTVLNAIDGVAAQENRILIMTTNHPERLDPALLRPGRVDMKINMGPIHRREVQQIFLMVYLQPTDTLFMEITPLSIPANPDWSLDDIDNLSTAFASKIPSGRFTAAEVQRYLLQYKHDPSAAVRNVKGLLFGLECDTDLSAFRIAESPHQFRFNDTAYCIRVSAHIFLWDLQKPYILLIQRALCDTKPGYWEVPAGSGEEQDQTPRDALEREVREETGLRLSRVTHALPIQTWARDNEGRQHEWIGLPYIIEVSELEPSKSRANRQGLSEPALKWKDAIQLNPQEHQDFAWATEDEVRRDKYKMFGNHKKTILEAFAMVTQTCSV